MRVYRVLRYEGEEARIRDTLKRGLPEGTVTEFGFLKISSVTYSDGQLPAQGYTDAQMAELPEHSIAAGDPHPGNQGYLNRLPLTIDDREELELLHAACECELMSPGHDLLNVETHNKLLALYHRLDEALEKA